MKNKNNTEKIISDMAVEIYALCDKIKASITHYGKRGVTLEDVIMYNKHLANYAAQEFTKIGI